jgi:hypothetical protein
MEFVNTISDKLSEQEWFQQLKGKWEELDPQSRSYLKMAGVASALILFLYLVVSSVWSIHELKKDLADKDDLLNVVQSANEELRRLRETGGAQVNAEVGNWSTYFETTATPLGIEKAALTISAEKPGTSSEVAKESLYDIGMKKVTIKQVVKYAFQLENGSRPVKMRNISINTNADPEGYMDATLSVSGFSLIPPPK